MTTLVRGTLKVVTRCDCPEHHAGEHHSQEPVDELVPVDLDDTPTTRQAALDIAARRVVDGRPNVDGWSWDEGVRVTPVGEDQAMRRLGAPTLFGF